MFRPNVNCTLRRLLDGYDVYGRAQLGQPVPMKCGVVKLRDKRQQTTVRADSSGSRGFGEEQVVDVKLLLPKSSEVKAGDVIAVAGMSLEVAVVHQRFAMSGRLDHYEVECIAWQSK